MKRLAYYTAYFSGEHNCSNLLPPIPRHLLHKVRLGVHQRQKSGGVLGLGANQGQCVPVLDALGVDRKLVELYDALNPYVRMITTDFLDGRFVDGARKDDERNPRLREQPAP
jgi:hypothetical protein